MNWSDIPRDPPARVLRQFAALWLVCLNVLAWRLGFAGGRTAAGAALAGLGVAVGLPGLARPRAVRGLFVALMVLTWPIGWAVSHLVMAALYYGVFTPLGLCFRAAGRDVLALRPRPGRATYWEPRPPAGGARRYFQPF
jgi:hypothetical protein